MLQLTFNPGLTLTGFRTTRPRGIVFLFTKRILRKIMHKSNRCFKLELEWVVLVTTEIALKSKKVIQKRKKWHEIRKVA